MPRENILCPVLVSFLLLTAFSHPCLAQSSIGFANPDDTANILNYRLPDWGYRTWDLGFSLSGRGYDEYANGEERFSHDFSTFLDSDLYLYRESEKRKGFLDVSLKGQYSHSHEGSESSERSSRHMYGGLDFTGSLEQYLGEGPFFVGITGEVLSGYREEKNNFSFGEEAKVFSRELGFGFGPAAGVGRVRDVTPLVRAQRLSERLASLGRPRLTSIQVQEIARVLAREHGYREIFDRPERSFWRDVLAPMLERDIPLSPYEIFYLRDILVEDIGPRYEGLLLRAGVNYRELRHESGRNEGRNYFRRASLAFSWVRNWTLNHQLSLNAAIEYWGVNGTYENSGGSSRSERRFSLQGLFDLAHLWTIADRYRLDTILGLSSWYAEDEYPPDRSTGRNYRTSLLSAFKIFLEDNLSLVARARGSNQHSSSEYYWRNWNWSYSIGLEFYLDRVLY